MSETQGTESKREEWKRSTRHHGERVQCCSTFHDLTTVAFQPLRTCSDPFVWQLRKCWNGVLVGHSTVQWRGVLLCMPCCGGGVFACNRMQFCFETSSGNWKPSRTSRATIEDWLCMCAFENDTFILYQRDRQQKSMYGWLVQVALNK
jgi:hypothetical protein